MTLLLGRRPIAALESRLPAEAASENRRSGSRSTGLPTSPPKFGATFAPERRACTRKEVVKAWSWRWVILRGIGKRRGYRVRERQYYRRSHCEQAASCHGAMLSLRPWIVPEQKAVGMDQVTADLPELNAETASAIVFGTCCLAGRIGGNSRQEGRDPFDLCLIRR